MGATLRNMLADMESAFISILLEAACKMGQVVESKVFILMESTDGLRSVGMLLEATGIHLKGDVDSTLLL